MSSNIPTPAPPVNAANPPPSVRRCENCAAPLYGDHCYHCGQPTKGLVRRFGTILGDFLDTVFNIDSRVFRTIGPLLARPGYLTLEYLAGRRVRYVSPVRLFVFVSVLAFLATRWSVTLTPGDGGLRIGTGDDNAIAAAHTPAEVLAVRDRALAELEKGRKRGANVPGLSEGLAAAETEIRKQADERLAELKAESRTRAAGVGAGTPGVGPPPGSNGPMIDDNTGTITFGNGKPWDPKTNPVHLDWLPAAGNEKLNAWILRGRDNAREFKKDPNKLKDAFLGVLPQTLFVMLPLFALLLKVMYLFKRRLYMEHLIVALHSHAFLCLSIGLLALLNLGEGALPGGVLATAVGWMETLVLLWMPVYLLLTQKRVYGQGWILTVVKFGVIGMAYFFLLVFAGLGALAVSLVAS